MRTHRFIGAFDLSKDSITTTDKEVLNQWKNVLRLSAGDPIILCDGKGTEAEGVIQEVHKERAVVAIQNTQETTPGPQKNITLCLALLKRENFELAVQKAVELGIYAIQPLYTKRTIKTGFNRERLEKIIKEATEQSGRTVLPVLLEPISLTESLTTSNSKVLFDLSGEDYTKISFPESTHIYIGPEGGFEPSEVTLAKESGSHIATTGDLTLRAETAAVIASWIAVQ